jgi:hypothetical protein
MYTLLRKTQCGWTDYNGSSSSEFETQKAAQIASDELDMIWGTTSEWKIVPTKIVNFYNLVS